MKGILKNYHEQAVLWSTMPNQAVFTIARSMGIDVPNEILEHLTEIKTKSKL